MTEKWSDPAAWVENFWIPAVLMLTIWLVTLVPKWLASRADERRRADADARKIVSREFAKVATQMSSLSMYRFGTGMYPDEVLAKKQDECLEVILKAARGPADPIARNAGAATLSRLGVTATSLTVGNAEPFALAYKRAQVEYLGGVTEDKPESRMDLAAWARTYRFGAKVLDAHQIGPIFGFLRLGLKSMRVFEDVARVECYPKTKVRLWGKLRWLFSQ